MNQQPNSIVFNSSKGPIQVQPTRMAVYNRLKIVEMTDDNQQLIYLFFYQNKFISGSSLNIDENPPLQSLFDNGMILTSPHPLIDVFLNEKQNFKEKQPQQIINSLKKHSPQETTLILFYLEPLLSQEKIMKQIKEIYDNCRRNGKMRLSYQLLITILAFDSENKWAKDMASHIDFLKIKLRYKSDDTTHDPLYEELQLYKQRHASFLSFHNLLSKQNRWFDLITVYIDYFRTSKKVNPSEYRSLRELMAKHLTDEEQALLLWDIYKELPAIEEIQTDIINGLVQQSKYEDAINIIVDTSKKSSSALHDQLIELLEKETIDINHINLEDLKSYILTMKQEPVTKAINLLIPQLLKERSMVETYHWLTPFKKLPFSLSILEKLENFTRIQEDPEQQLSLGKIYYEFQHFNQAIECFSWEMELHPADPIPVQWITKSYRKLGMVEESNYYQNVYSMLQQA